MRKSKVLVYLFLGLSLFLLSSFVMSIPASAESTEKDPTISEERLNQIFAEAGAPQELINRWGMEQKLSLYLNSTSFTYDTTGTKEFNLVDGQLEEDNEIKLFTISPSKLTVSHDIFSASSGGEKYKSVYANYAWNQAGHRTFNDKIGIAIPNGWEIQAQSYYCNELQSGTGSGSGGNPSSHGNCDGAPYSLNYYGAAWELTGNDKVWNSGYVHFDMKRISTNAQLKVISTYAADYTSAGSISFGVGWGPLSLSFTPNNSSDSDQVAWDTAFTW